MKTLITSKSTGKTTSSPWNRTGPLWTVLRMILVSQGPRRVVGPGECGSCTVILNGKPVNSCLVLAIQANGAEILTIEGLKPPTRSSPAPAGLCGERGHPVRVLHSGHDSLCEQPS